jgi:hypothetical protein
MTPRTAKDEKLSRLAAERHCASFQAPKGRGSCQTLIYDWDIDQKYGGAPATRVLGWQIDEVAPNVEGGRFLHPATGRLKALQNRVTQADDDYVMEYRLSTDKYYVWVLDSGRVFVIDERDPSPDRSHHRHFSTQRKLGPEPSNGFD